MITLIDNEPQLDQEDEEQFTDLEALLGQLLVAALELGD